MEHNTVQIGNVVGIISVVVFVICMFWGALLPDAQLQQLHQMLLQIIYPGYSASIGGFLIGLVEAFVYGWALGAGFAWLCRKLCK